MDDPSTRSPWYSSREMNLYFPQICVKHLSFYRKSDHLPLGTCLSFAKLKKTSEITWLMIARTMLKACMTTWSVFLTERRNIVDLSMADCDTTAQLRFDLCKGSTQPRKHPPASSLTGHQMLPCELWFVQYELHHFSQCHYVPVSPGPWVLLVECDDWRWGVTGAPQMSQSTRAYCDPIVVLEKPRNDLKENLLSGSTSAVGRVVNVLVVINFEMRIEPLTVVHILSNAHSIGSSVRSATSRPQPQMNEEGSLRVLMDAIVFMSPCKGKVVYCRLPRPAQMLSAGFYWPISLPLEENWSTSSGACADFPRQQLDVHVDPATMTMKGLSSSRSHHHTVTCDPSYDSMTLGHSDRRSYFLNPGESHPADHSCYTQRNSFQTECNAYPDLASCTFPRRHYSSHHELKEECGPLVPYTGPTGNSKGSGGGGGNNNRIPSNLLEQFERQAPVRREGYHTLQYKRTAVEHQRSDSPGRIRHLVHSVQKLFTKSHSLEGPSGSGGGGSGRMNGGKSSPDDPPSSSGTLKHSKRSKSKDRSKSEPKMRTAISGYWSSDDTLDREVCLYHHHHGAAVEACPPGS
ncbi:hypothetical protein INR49_014878 [Caranx melampygus]|nr:hypothetical protein INR49_014878 [Caranx melampygus]